MFIFDTIDHFISGDWGADEASDETPKAVRCIRGADINNVNAQSFENVPIRYVAESSTESKHLQAGDIIIEKSGGSPTQSTGRVAFISQQCINNLQNVVCSNFCAAFRVKENWNPKYVFYYLQHVYNSGIFFNFEGKTSGLRNLQLENAFKSIPINHIDKTKQDWIVNVLDKIENKIALSNSINRNLEQLINETTQYTFFDKSKPLLRTTTVGEIAAIKAGGDCPRQWSKSKTPKYKIPIYSNGVERNGLYGYAETAIIDKPSVTIAARGTIGFCVLRNEPYVPIIRLLSICPKARGGDIFLYYIFKKMVFEKNGSVQQQLTVPMLSNLSIPYPSTNQLERYDDIIRPCIISIQKNNDQIFSLHQLRDELLPMLLIGQVNCDLSQ